MINGKTIGIDARMVEMSGIGTYIKHLLGNGIYDYAIGQEKLIRKYDSEVKVIEYNAPIYRLKEQLHYPVRQIRKAGIDIMHFPHYNVPLTYRGRYVVTVHDLTHIVFPEYLESKIKSIYAHKLMKHALINAEHVFTVSKYSKNDIEKYFKLQSNKITVTYNAVDSDYKVESPDEYSYLYEKYKIPENRKIVLYVGNLKPHKNLITLIRTLKYLDSSIVLLLVGRAFSDKPLEEFGAAYEAVKDRVYYTGEVKKPELIDLYNLADVFAFPSLYEGFGIPPLEAMACGTPVVAANDSSIPEVVGSAAILVDGKDARGFAKAIDQLLDNNDLRAALISMGKKRIKTFSWDKTVDLVKKTLETVI